MSVSTDVPRSAALARTIGLPGALLLTLSAITPASSVFVILPGAIKVAGSGVLIAMLAAMIVGVCMAFVYAELASAFPHTGGEYVFVGRTLGPAPGFMFLGLTVVGAALSPAVLALGVGEYVAVLFPGLSPATVAALLIACATLLGILNIRANAWLTGTFLAIELMALIALTYLGFAHQTRTLGEVLAHPFAVNGGQLQTVTAPMIGVATALAIFAYNGYGGAVYFGEEMREASTRIARTVLWSLALGVLTQIVPMAAVLVGAPDLAGLLASDRPFNDFVVARGGTLLNVVLSAGVALAMTNAVIVLMLSNARLLFSTGRDRAWSPVLNRILMRVHPRFHSPWGATLVAGGAGIAPCWLGFDTLLIFTGTSLVAIYAGVCIAAIAGRRGDGTIHAAYRMPWFPVAPVFCLCFLAYVGYTNWADTDIGRPSLLANAAVMLVAAAYYRYVVRRTGAWTLHGPEMG